MFWSLVGQGLNFAAMLLPVVLKSGDQLAFLMLPLSAAAILRELVSAAFHVRYLTVPTEERRIAVGVASFGLTSFSVLTVATAGGVAFFSSVVGLVIFSIAILTYSIGFYFVAVTILIAEKNIKDYGRGRLIFGIVNFGSTFAAIWAFDFVFGLVVANALTNFMLAVWMIAKSSVGLQDVFFRSWSYGVSAQGLRYLASSRSVVVSTLIANLGVQIQGLLTPLMGDYKELWAIVVRLSGGFGTLGQQILAPTFEMHATESVRNGSEEHSQSWARRAQAGGVVFGLIVATLLAIALVFLYPELIAEETWLVWVCAAYCWLLLSSSLTLKIPYILGHDRSMLIWTLLRLGLTIPLFLFHGSALLIVLVAVQAVVSIYLVFITLKTPMLKLNNAKPV
ncbi:hypothetical protein QQA05_09675 [Corynebacterium macclintockiae]|uniref:hypothetical protein n=1 Tax=Corynebacterium macclintockiae TaxID=2913501 RepID=UPI00254FAA7F|nr:hypothetical protein [Corynebacterium macclintockiae]MDK8891660.1 hypothetical protein [Corynebacterium macclintockiae]